jgi:hypothetical protein
MALIPPDAGLRMRMQTEANLLQPVAPVHEIPSDLPELRPGQTFSARIQEVLPDNSYKALVAGKQLTLQLPEGAKAGDTLELLVIDRSNKVVIAKQVETRPTAADDANAPYPFAKFSPAARLIGQLLPAEGEAAQPAALGRGAPILPQPPQSPVATAQLASNLAKAVSQSGVFYESHQAQWVTGKLPLAQLLQEPQGQRSAQTAYQFAAVELVARFSAQQEQPDAPPVEQAARQAAADGGAARQAGSAGIAAALQQGLNPGKVGAGETAGSAPAPASAAQVAAAAQQVPDELRPLVQQQLEAAGTQRLFWHGEVWPRQAIDWEIEWEGERAADGSEEESLRWRTALSLTTPRLGRVDASLQLSAQGVSIALATPHGASAADLRAAAPQLAEALGAAGVPLLGFQVRHEEPTPPAEAA